jgi:hypothetical protein
MFDMKNTGFAVHTGWVASDDGVLVLDINENGEVDNAAELFGAPDGAQGFAALAEYDTNQDGVIDAGDAIYAQLQVWRDLDGNAKVDEGELFSLAELDIASITVAATPQTDLMIAGNQVTATGSFTRGDNSTGAIADVVFTVDPFHTRYLGDTSVSEAAAARANLKGYGTLTDLHVAMTLDPMARDTRLKQSTLL